MKSTATTEMSASTAATEVATATAATAATGPCRMA
jgi:hypothetical protein